MYQGEIAALTAAFVWAISTWIYGQFSHHFSSLAMNIIKGTVASFMMGLVLPVLPGEVIIPDKHLALILAVSGIVGIAIGDSAYFAALRRIGANKTLLLESLAPPLSGVFALLILGSVLSVKSWLGVLVVTLSVAFVVFQPTKVSQSNNGSGIAYGLLASICQAAGVVISHFALVAGDVNPLLGALIRLSVGTLCVIMFILFAEPTPYKTLLKHARQLTRKSMLLLMSAIFVGTFLALWLQQVAVKYANPAVAQTLLATSPLFILFISAWRGESVTPKTVIGTLTALGGISLFFL